MTKEKVALAPDEQPVPTKKERRLRIIKLAVSLMLPVFLETLDQTVVATAQTRIASQFNSLGEQQWIGTAYLLTATVFLPIFGSIADIFGRYWALQLATLLFIIGSAICTGAQNMIPLIIGRALSGIGAGGLTTLARIILNDSGNLKDNNTQTAILSLLYAIGYAVGPVIGGGLATANWRWCFAINLPCCVLGMLASYFFLRHHPNPAAPPPGTTAIQKLQKIDYVGAFLFVSGGVLIILGLSWGSQEEWNEPRVIAVFVVGGVLVILFYLWERFLERRVAGPHKEVAWLAEQPMIPAALFKDLDVIATSVIIFGGGMLMFGMFYFVSTYFIIVQGYSQIRAGLVLLAFTPGLGVGVMISRRVILVTKQAKYVCVVGAFLAPIGAGLTGMAMQNGNTTELYVFTAIVGLSCGLVIPSTAIQLRFTHQSDEVATVVALSMFFRTMGGTVGLAQMGAVLNAKARDSLLAAAYLGQYTAQEIGEAIAALVSQDLIQGLPEHVLNLVRSSMSNGVYWSFISLIPWVGVGALISLFMSRHLMFEEPQN
ncbi:MFS general substrate transporter [Dacryopinax primogenitus]|uniref:MFS general substrate transporter n=1 Tax=Dacryopinax primogenitus (strain DJM 731) TaxID=1858805 RepID=M5FWQ9_DACPD|nr:MFS general substrate transporter [Dacryopinax primogenitus]EJU00834.1 MFS general substrate transporter [Dacryopinax primogenitus]